MTDRDWHTLYRDTCETFHGQTPGAQLEQDLIDAWQQSPHTIEAMLAKTAAAYTDGKITSPWGIIRTQLQRLNAQPHLSADHAADTAKRIARAEAWIRDAGYHLDEPEVIRHLFGPTEHTADLTYLQDLEQSTRGNPGRPLYDGLLQAAIRRTREHGPEEIPWTGGTITDLDSPDLRERLLDLWANHRPAGLAVERDAIARAEAWKAAQHLMKQKLAAAHAEEDTCTNTPTTSSLAPAAQASASASDSSSDGPRYPSPSASASSSAGSSQQVANDDTPL